MTCPMSPKYQVFSMEAMHGDQIRSCGQTCLGELQDDGEQVADSVFPAEGSSEGAAALYGQQANGVLV